MMQVRPSSIAPYVAAMAFGVGGEAELCQAAEAAYLSDRGDGIPTSLLGTYVREKEFIFYPFYEYTRFKKFEYKPSELGFTGEQEFFGKLVEREALVFLAYAFNDSLAIEFESAVHASANFTKAPEDNSTLPASIRESGLGDTETNIRWRYLKETQSRPELTFFMKTVFPLQRDKKLLGTPVWEFAPGVVVTKGYSFGTLAGRLAAGYDTGEHKVKFDEWAVDYVKRLDSNWRFVLSLEGAQLDEVSLIGELQYTLTKNAVLKLNMGVGVTTKAPTYAPEIGVMFRF